MHECSRYKLVRTLSCRTIARATRELWISSSNFCGSGRYRDVHRVADEVVR